MKPKPFCFTTKMRPHLHISLFFHLLLFTTLSSSTEFIFNGFNTSNILLFGNATIEPPPHNILTLTNNTPYSIGRALYKSKIRTKPQNSSSVVLPFSTSFIFAMAPYRNVLPGHGLVFIFTPFVGINGSGFGQYLGFINRTLKGRASNHLFGVEFDVFSNEEYRDINDNHVGININSLTSIKSETAGYWLDRKKGDNQSEFKKLKLNDGRDYQVWIDYRNFVIDVTIAPIGMSRPRRPLLSVNNIDLSSVFEEKMYVGFTAATAKLVESHKILAWSFSNSDFSLSSSLITRGLPSFVLTNGTVFQSKGFIGGVTAGFLIMLVALFVLLLIRKKKMNGIEKERFEEWELEYWPHRIVYQDVEAATKGFSDKNVIGIGANGKVYKGVLPGGVEVAVKRILREDDDGMREFLAEVSSLGRLKHRNLVGLRGWCKREQGSFLLVYDYMENGSLDMRVFECDESKMLNCEDRIRILKDVALGILYLHEGWEAKVLHRDIKASNVLLDKEMNGRLGDFGLARMHDHGKIATTTRVVGTVGYLAPEVIRTGRASVQTDVFGFGVLILEVMCGRRPIKEGKHSLVDWVWQAMAQGESINALDERLKVKGEFDPEEVIRVLHLGLLCSHPDPSARPNMRQVVKVFEGNNEAIDLETEDMGTYSSSKSKEVWNNNPRNFGYRGSHPTFEDIRQSLSSSMSISCSNSILVGR